jgi:hypothetical protein
MEITTMKHLQLVIAFLVTSILLSACSAIPLGQIATESSIPPLVTGSVTAPAANAAQQMLAQKLNLPMSKITVVSVESTQWPDSCLGLPEPGEVCAMIVISGYKIMLTAGGQTYIARTTQDGSEVRFESGTPTSPSGKQSTATPPVSGGDISTTEANPAVRKAVNYLASHLNASATSITVENVVSITWSNSCLDIATGKACLMVLTPGYKIILEAAGKTYEIHTDSTGMNVALLTDPALSMVPTITWQSPDQPCQMAVINLSGLSFGSCDGVLNLGKLVNSARITQLTDFVNQFASFGANTMAGLITFNGSGQETATPAQQRAIAEWARLVFMEAQSGRSGAAWGLAFSWHRQGGIAGFCDDLGVYLDGAVVASSCKSQSANAEQFIFSADQLAKLYEWIDEYQPFDVKQSDQAVSDAMTVVLDFNGTGTTNPDQAQRQEILSFASEVFNKAGQ